MHKCMHVHRSTAVPMPNVGMTQREQRTEVSTRKLYNMHANMARHADAMQFPYSSITMQ